MTAVHILNFNFFTYCVTDFIARNPQLKPSKLSIRACAMHNERNVALKRYLVIRDNMFSFAKEVH